MVRFRRLSTVLVLVTVLVSAASPALAFPATAFGDWANIELSHSWAQGYVGLAAALGIMKGFDRGDVPIDPGNGKPPILYRDLYERDKDNPDPLYDVVRSMPPTYPGTDGLLAPREFGVVPAVPFTRAQAAATVARVGLGVFGNPVPLNPGVMAFADVDDGAWYAPYVHALQNAGIIDTAPYVSGGTARFGPDRPVTRGELTAWIGRILKAANVTPETVSQVQPMKWVNGQHGHRWAGNYEKIEWFTVSLPKPSDKKPDFPDVPDTYPGADGIRYAAQLGIVSGYDVNGRRVFDPGRPVTRLEAAVLLVKLANLLTDNPPTLDELVEINNKASAIESELDRTIRPDMSYREIYELYRQSDLGKYLTSDEIFADGGDVSGAWKGRALPRSRFIRRTIAAKPVFLGTRFAVIEVVDKVSSELVGMTNYYGNLLFYVREKDGWKVSGVASLFAKPTWWTKDHCDSLGRCSE